ncbi:MAG: hypothetical protein WC476_11730 [Phycisphaerae bacterium]|jgi:hypothetical protein
MTREQTARDHWKAAVKMFGKGSKEELFYYRAYVQIRQGGGKKEKRAKIKTVPKQLFETEQLWQAVS